MPLQVKAVPGQFEPERTFSYRPLKQVSSSGLEEVGDLVKHLFVPLVLIGGAWEHQKLWWLRLAGGLLLGLGGLRYASKAVQEMRDRSLRSREGEMIITSEEGVIFQNVSSYKSASWQEVTGIEPSPRKSFLSLVSIWRVTFRSDSFEFSSSLPEHRHLEQVIAAGILRKGEPSAQASQ